MNALESCREFLKSDHWDTWDPHATEQGLGKPHPPLETPYPEDAELIDLVAPETFTIGTFSLIEAMRARKSHRKFANTPLTLEELSFLLWATQGVHKIFRGGVALRRTVPSAGARHPFEAYLLVNRVQDLDPGLYRYLSVEHKLCFLYADPALPARVGEACNDQQFVGSGAVTFIWTAVPYRTVWRYAEISPKLIALDAGHVCQNLYLASEAIGAGTCAIAAYNQEKLDMILGVDGEEEFAVYVAPVGKID